MNIKSVNPMCNLRVAAALCGLLFLSTSATATTYAYTYDTSGRLQAIDTPTKKIIYTFDAAGNQTSVAVQTKGVDVAVAIDAPPAGTQFAGDQFDYIVQVSNVGSVSASLLELTFNPDPSAPVQVTTPGSWSCIGTGPVTCTLASLDVGITSSVVFGVSLNSPGSINSSASIATNDAVDVQPSNNSYSVDSVVSELGEDIDGDGMLDALELAAFGTLARDGDGDFDGDGVSDRDELRNETDPTIGLLTGAPQIETPIHDTKVSELLPTLVVINGDHFAGAEPTYEFELYRDEGLTDVVELVSAVAEGAGSTSWSPSQALVDNARYYWRARARSGNVNSQWTTASFRVNTSNDAPSPPHVSTPSNAVVVTSLVPDLAVNNSSDVDSDALHYRFEVFADAAATSLVVASTEVPQHASGETTWHPNTALTDGLTYFWRATAIDEQGAESVSSLWSFTVDALAPALSVAGAVSPNAESIASSTVDLVAQNAQNTTGATLSYHFELDTVSTFDSANLMTSGALSAGAVDETTWPVSGLAEDQTYFWRVQVSDGVSESRWSVASFVVNSNDEPALAPVAGALDDGSWTGAVRPSLDVRPSVDAENDIGGYEFELYADAGLAAAVEVSGVVGTRWQPDTALSDQAWYYWRARARDVSGQAGAWSQPVAFFVDDDGVDEAPRLSWLLPGALLTSSGESVRLQWRDRDSDSDATISLYYQSDASDADAVQFIAGLAESADENDDIVMWDLSGVASGDYSVYAEISDGVTTDVVYLTPKIAVMRDNELPVAVDDSASVNWGAAVNINVAVNDSDADAGLNLASVVIVDQPVNGSALVNADGSIDYLHDGGETTSDSFTYTIADTAGVVSNLAVVTVSVSPAGTFHVNFSAQPVLSYAGSQDETPTHYSIEDGGATLHLMGNTWKAIALTVPFDVAADSVLEFDFKSNGAQAEVNGVGLSNNISDLNDADTFAVFGSQTWGNRTYHGYDGAGAYRHYAIPIGAHYAPGQRIYVFFANDADAGQNTSVFYSNVTLSGTQPPGINAAPVANDDSASVNEGAVVNINVAVNDSDADVGLNLASIVIVDQPVNGSAVVNADGGVDYVHDGGETTSDSFTYTIADNAGAESNVAAVTVTVLPVGVTQVNFFAQPLLSYAGSQDGMPTHYSIEDGGATLHMMGNTWKAIELTVPFDVTPDTVLEFDFKSDGAQAEINGVGVSNTIAGLSETDTFAVFGSQTWGDRSYYGYSGAGAYQHFVLPIGAHYAPGQRIYVFFANDADAGQNTSVFYSNVTLSDTQPPGVNAAVDEGAGISVSVTSNGTNANYELNLASLLMVEQPADASVDFALELIDLNTPITLRPTAELVADVDTGPLGVSDVTVLGNVTVFTAETAGSGRELWISDGTTVGTSMVADLVAGATGSNPSALLARGSNVYFLAEDGAGGKSLWVSDGSAANTHDLGAVAPDAGYLVLLQNTLYASNFPATVAGDSMYFVGDNGVNGLELWRFDGAASSMVADIWPGAGSSDVTNLVAVGSELYFSANDGVSGDELWRSDGTAAGTVLVADINPGAGASYPSAVVSSGAAVYFTASDGSSGDELWSSDGTAIGTMQVADIWPGAGSSAPGELTLVNEELYFAANDSVNGRELWVSDGTAAGTSMLADLHVGPGSSFPQWLVNAGGLLYFAADDGIHGQEPWISDGTQAGTFIVDDLVIGIEPSTPFFTSAGVRGVSIFLSADVGGGTAGLWLVSPNAEAVADGDAN